MRHIFDALISIAPFIAVVVGGVWAIVKGLREHYTYLADKDQRRHEYALKEAAERNINLAALRTLREDVDDLKKLQAEDKSKSERLVALINKLEGRYQVIREMVMNNGILPAPRRNTKNDEP